MTNNENFYFAGKCLTLNEHPEFKGEIIQIIESDSINWASFVSLCSNHLILPVLYLKFKAHDIIAYLPKELSEFLNEIYQLNLIRNHQILKQLHEICKLLNENGIYPTVLKGAGNLAGHLYSDLGERMMGDIDLLVHEEDYLPAAHLLERDGYYFSIEALNNIKRAKHYPRLMKSGVPADVEIHRIPVNQPYIKWYNTEIIDTEKKAINEDAFYYVLSDNHKAIHNFIHSQLSDKGNNYGIVSLRNIYDLYLLSNRISIAATLPSIQHKRKAITYFIFAGKALGIPKMFYADETFSSRLFCLKHHLNQSSSVFFLTYRSLRYVYERIIIGYSEQFIKSFYSKEMRQSLFARLNHPQWRRNHLDTYIRFFSVNK